MKIGDFPKLDALVAEIERRYQAVLARQGEFDTARVELAQAKRLLAEAHRELRNRTEDVLVETEGVDS